MDSKEPVSLSPGVYIVAVSGGIDSVVLLDMLSRLQGVELIVAHYDHGIRDDSGDDAEFVAGLANNYGLAYEGEAGNLGSEASEAEAREARYSFLRKAMSKHRANAIITAHHQDDLLETAIINLIRGTGRRGLSSLESTQKLHRPLLGFTKQHLLDYAEVHSLEWREDSTNSNTKYLRNNIRLNLLPKADSDWRAEMLARIAKASDLNRQIDIHIDSLLGYHLRSGKSVISRRWFVKLPHNIAAEVAYVFLRSHGTEDINRMMVERLVISIKAARPGKKLDIDKNHYMLLTKRSARLMNRTTNKSVHKSLTR